MSDGFLTQTALCRFIPSSSPGLFRAVQPMGLVTDGRRWVCLTLKDEHLAISSGLDISKEETRSFLCFFLFFRVFKKGSFVKNPSWKGEARSCRCRVGILRVERLVNEFRRFF